VEIMMEELKPCALKSRDTAKLRYIELQYFELPVLSNNGE